MVISVLAFMIQFEKFLRSVVENVEGNYQHFNNKLPVPIGTLTVRSIFVMIFLNLYQNPDQEPEPPKGLGKNGLYSQLYQYTTFRYMLSYL